MGVTDDEAFFLAIEQAPGPAPWYLSKPASNLSTPPHKLIWERDYQAGPTLLKDDTNKEYAAIGIYSYLWRISATQFIVWRADAQELNNPATGNVYIDLYEISQLKPLSIRVDAPTLKKAGTHFVANAAPIASTMIPRNLPQGESQITVPESFWACREILILVSDPNWDKPNLNLWIISPSVGTIQVVPQTWFTSGSFDFGYQWVTRITRELSTRNLVGDGIRIGEFLLDPTGEHLLRWLRATINA